MSFADCVKDCKGALAWRQTGGARCERLGLSVRSQRVMKPEGGTLKSLTALVEPCETTAGTPKLLILYYELLSCFFFFINCVRY